MVKSAGKYWGIPRGSSYPHKSVLFPRNIVLIFGGEGADLSTCTVNRKGEGGWLPFTVEDIKVREESR